MGYLTNLGFLALASANHFTSDAHQFLKSQFHESELINYSALCQHTVDNYVYDFKDLQNDKSDYVIENALGDGKFTFNFCKTLTNPCKIDAFAALDSSGCEPLSGGNMEEDRKTTLIEAENGSKHGPHVLL